MKKIGLLLAMVCFTQIIVAQTEKRFYVNTNFGYNIGTGNVNYYQAQLFFYRQEKNSIRFLLYRYNQICSQPQ